MLFSGKAFVWALQALCALHRKPFSIELAQQQFPAPYTPDSFVRAVAALGFDATQCKAKAAKLQHESFPLIAWLAVKPASNPTTASRGDSSVSDVPTAAAAPSATATPSLILQCDGV